MTSGVAAVCYAAGVAFAIAPIGLPEHLRQGVGAVVAMCLGAVGFAWVVVRAFDIFDVDGRRRGMP